MAPPGEVCRGTEERAGDDGAGMSPVHLVAAHGVEPVVVEVGCELVAPLCGDVVGQPAGVHVAPGKDGRRRAVATHRRGHAGAVPSARRTGAAVEPLREATSPAPVTR